MAFTQQAGDDVGVRRLVLLLVLHAVFLPLTASAEQASIEFNEGLYLAVGGALPLVSEAGERPGRGTGGLLVEGGLLVAGGSSYVWELGLRAQEGVIRERAALGGLRLSLLPDPEAHWAGFKPVVRAAMVVGARYVGRGSSLSLGPRLGLGLQRRLGSQASIFVGADTHMRIAPFVAWLGFTVAVSAAWGA